MFTVGYILFNSTCYENLKYSVDFHLPFLLSFVQISLVAHARLHFITCLISAALLDSPQMLIAEEEKIIIEETSGNQTIVEEKYVSYCLAAG